MLLVESNYQQLPLQLMVVLTHLESPSPMSGTNSQRYHKNAAVQCLIFLDATYASHF